MEKEVGKAVANSTVVTAFFKDLIRPSARRIGASLDTIAKVALSPIEVLDWGYERSRDWLRRKIEARFSGTSLEFVTEPKAGIVYEAIRHIATSHDAPELRDLYAELLLKAMDVRTTEAVHPAYFHIIEQLAPNEALVLVGLHEKKEPYFTDQLDPWGGYHRGSSVEDQFSAFCESALTGSGTSAEVWLTNLCRLGLLRLLSTSEAILEDQYDHVGPKVNNYEHRCLEFTEFGSGFISACAPADRVSTEESDLTTVDSA